MRLFYDLPFTELLALLNIDNNDEQVNFARIPVRLQGSNSPVLGHSEGGLASRIDQGMCSLPKNLVL